MPTIKDKIEAVLNSNPESGETHPVFLGTFDYKDLVQSDQDMLLTWNDNGGELTKTIKGIKFKLNVLF